MEFVPMNTVSDRYYIYTDNEVVGVLEYVDYGDEIEIKYIKIHEEYRRMGIATRVVNILKGKTKLITGDALPEAVKFWESLHAEFSEPFPSKIRPEVLLTPFVIN